MVYVNPSTQRSQYSKIMLEPVEFWDGAETSVSPADQHMLRAYFYSQLKKDLQANFTLVDQGGPGALLLQIALTNAIAATPGLRSVSVKIPQARILNGIQSLATGSYAFVGSAEGQLKRVDAVLRAHARPTRDRIFTFRRVFVLSSFIRRGLIGRIGIQRSKITKINADESLKSRSDDRV